MRLVRRHTAPLSCDAPRCERVATVRLSNGPDSAASCGLHVLTFERRWGQVFVKGISR